MYIGNAMVPETYVSALAQVGSVVGGGFSGPQAGPVSYTEGSMNPPDLTLWGVQKAWPVKRDLYAHAVLTVL